LAVLLLETSSELDRYGRLSAALLSLAYLFRSDAFGCSSLRSEPLRYGLAGRWADPAESVASDPIVHVLRPDLHRPAGDKGKLPRPAHARDRGRAAAEHLRDFVMSEERHGQAASANEGTAFTAGL
jgi:hypothetical protein